MCVARERDPALVCRPGCGATLVISPAKNRLGHTTRLFRFGPGAILLKRLFEGAGNLGGGAWIDTAAPHHVDDRAITPNSERRGRTPEHRVVLARRVLRVAHCSRDSRVHP